MTTSSSLKQQRQTCIVCPAKATRRVNGDSVCDRHGEELLGIRRHVARLLGGRAVRLPPIYERRKKPLFGGA